MHRAKVGNIILTKKTTIEGYKVPGIRYYYKNTIIQAVCYWYNDR